MQFLTRKYLRKQKRDNFEFNFLCVAVMSIGNVFLCWSVYSYTAFPHKIYSSASVQYGDICPQPGPAQGLRLPALSGTQTYTTLIQNTTTHKQTFNIILLQRLAEKLMHANQTLLKTFDQASFKNMKIHNIFYFCNVWTSKWTVTKIECVLQ